MSETGRVLKPANENPWYVLMTLYGEQDGEVVDEALHEKNRRAWNAWACQGMSEEESAVFCQDLHVTIKELPLWEDAKEDIERQHEAEMMRRNDTGFAYPGLPDVSKYVNFCDIHFVHNVIFAGLIFYKSAAFDFARFQREAFYADVVFCENASFLNAIFCKSGHFDFATFRGVADFESVTFQNDAIFSGSKFYFKGEFRGAWFSGQARFTMTSFLKSVRFKRASFDEQAAFHGAVFRNSISFDFSIFAGGVDFSKSVFGYQNERSWVDFIGTQFQKSVNFSDAKFFDSYPKFDGVAFQQSAIFSAKPSHWPKEAQLDPEQAKASCAVIRHNLGKQGLPEEEHFFFRREMGFAAQIGGWWQRLPYRVFGAVSDFGYSIQRPALWLFGLWLAVAMINHVVLQWAASRQGADYHVVQAFGLSFANQFPVFGLQGRWFSVEFLRDLNPWLKALGGVQTVLSLPLLFFFALGLRTRFRMR